MNAEFDDAVPRKVVFVHVNLPFFNEAHGKPYRIQLNCVHLVQKQKALFVTTLSCLVTKLKSFVYLAIIIIMLVTPRSPM